MSEGLFRGLWLLAIVSIPAAFGCAVFLYKRERARVGSLAYILILLVCAVVAFMFGLSSGINLACVQYPSGNLCGLFGFFVAGPLASSLTVILVSLLMRLADREPSD